MLAMVMRPIARALLGRVQSELDSVPHPVDPPQYHAQGPDPDRVLIFGNGPAIGFGVRTQELALPGQVGRRLVAVTGRGVDVDLVARRRTPIEAAVPLLGTLRLDRYDGVVLVVGATDAAAFLPLRRWRSAMSAMLAELTRATSPVTPIVVLGIHSLRRSALTAGVLGDLVDRHARRLNAITRALCEADPRLTFIERDDVRGETVRYQSAEAFALLAEMIAPALVPGLARAARSPEGPRAVRKRPDPEQGRQAAVEALGLLDSAPEERFDRLVRMARTTFGTASAAVSLLDHDRWWAKSVAGPVAALPGALPLEQPRGRTLCDRTVRSDEVLVIGDLALDPEVHPDLVAAGFRFYAGAPIESPDGYRVGALCVLDTEPRRAEDVDRAVLHQLALRVQRELWASQPELTAPASTR